MIWLWDILNVIYSGHCYVKYIGGGHDIFLWGTKCSRQRYSAVWLMTGIGPQLSSRTMAVFEQRLKCRPWDCVWHFTPLSEIYLYSKQALDYSLKWQMRAPMYFVVAGLTKRSLIDRISLFIWKHKCFWERNKVVQLKSFNFTSWRNQLLLGDHLNWFWSTSVS